MRFHTMLFGMLGVMIGLSSAVSFAKSGIAVVEIDVRQPVEFQQEFFPLASKIFADAGGTFIVKPSVPTAVDDTPPKRVAIIRFESVAKAVETFASEAYRDARKIGDKYASFRIFVLEAPDQ